MSKITTIKDVLKINITNECNGQFRADALILTGTPPVGMGSTEMEALYDLLAKILFMCGSGYDEVHWGQVQRAVKEYWTDI